MKKRNLMLAALVLAMVLSASMSSAWAYFTTYTEAAGGMTIQLGSQTTIEEDFSNWTKHVTISNSEDSQPVYVRAIAFGGNQYGLSYSGEGWTLGDDGYYYYNTPVEAGQTTAELLVEITGVPAGADAEIGENFNVIVVYESTPVQYGEDGNALPADWSMKLTDNAEGGAEE